MKRLPTFDFQTATYVEYLINTWSISLNTIRFGEGVYSRVVEHGVPCFNSIIPSGFIIFP